MRPRGLATTLRPHARPEASRGLAYTLRPQASREAWEASRGLEAWLRPGEASRPRWPQPMGPGLEASSHGGGLALRAASTSFQAKIRLFVEASQRQKLARGLEKKALAFF